MERASFCWAPCVCGLGTGDILKVSLKTSTQENKHPSALPLHVTIVWTRNSIVKWKEKVCSKLKERHERCKQGYKEHTARQCNAMQCCVQVQYLQSVALPAEVPSLPLYFVFACIHLQHGYPSDSSVTIINSTAFLYTLYTGMASSTKFELFGQLYQYPDTICLH